MRRILRGEKRSGITAIEFTVVVAILCILVSAAIPLYGKHAKNAWTQEALDRMGEIITAARVRAIENPNAAGNPVWPSAAGGVFNLSDSPNFTYSIVSGAGDDANVSPFTIRACGIVGRRLAGTQIRITVPNIQSSADPPVMIGR
jgi:type II secretory pathway pseudopilin PulG